jgi:hypothetical protein
MDEKAVDKSLKDRFEDPKYLEEYGGKGFSYEDFTWDFTVAPWFVYQMLMVHRPGWKHGKLPRNVLDIGAATGIVQEKFREEFELDAAHGVEISENIWSKRITNDVFLGDILNLEGSEYELRRKLLPGGYDLVLVNLIMYLNEDEVRHLMVDVLPKLLTMRAMIFVVFAWDVCPHMISTYLGKGYGASKTDQAPIFCRPKYWWVDLLAKLGYRALGDDSGGVMAFEYDPKDPVVSPVFGNPFNCEITYPTSLTLAEKLKGMRAPVFVRHIHNDEARLFQWQQSTEPKKKDLYEYWQEVDLSSGLPDPIDLRPGTDIRGYAKRMADMAAIARTGMMGMVSNMAFRPHRDYVYHPGLITVFNENLRLWDIYSDLYIAASPTIDTVIEIVHPDWNEDGENPYPAT